MVKDKKETKTLLPKKEEEVFELEDGTIVKKFCLNRLSDGITNYETIWDTLDVVTKMARLDVTKNGEGNVTDVKLVLPKIDEIFSQIALKNFTTYHAIRLNDPDLSDEDLLQMRRSQLQKAIDSRGTK